MPIDLAFLIKPLSKIAIKYVSRLHSERQAGQRGSININLIDENLDKTFNRIRGGKFEDQWWESILKELGQIYIAPDFLRHPSIVNWVNQKGVEKNFKELARDALMNWKGRDTNTREKLIQSGLRITGEKCSIVENALDTVIAILVAGFKASIPRSQRSVAGMIQELYDLVQSCNDTNNLSNLNDAFQLQRELKIHSDFFTSQKRQELSRILAYRTFDIDKAQIDIVNLYEEVNQSVIVQISNSIELEIHYWAARLSAGDAENVTVAKQLRDELKQTECNFNLTIVDALIEEIDGNEDKALQMLRDQNNSDSRSVFFGLVSRCKGKQKALDWFEKQDFHDNLDFFTPLGWLNWSLHKAEQGNFDEASSYLSKLEDSWEELPALAFVEGLLNAAMLLPSDFQMKVLDGIPLYRGITPIQTKKAEGCHTRATYCVEYIKSKLHNFSNSYWQKTFSDWSTWLGLMNPKSDIGNSNRAEIQQLMEEGSERSVDKMRFAFAFCISFDYQPLSKYLEERKSLGGLDEKEQIAECFIFKLSMKPMEFAKYVENNKKRLNETVQPQLLMAMHIDALKSCNQAPDKIARVTADYEKILDETDFNHLLMKITDNKKNSVRKRYEDRFAQTNHLVDLKILIRYLQKIDDRKRVLPLLKTQFDREQTTDNALQVVKYMFKPPFQDYESIIKFLSNNSYVFEQSDDLKRAKGIAFFNLGHYEEAKEINNVLLQSESRAENILLDLKISISAGNWERIGGILNCAWEQRHQFSPKNLLDFAYVASQQNNMQEMSIEFAKLAVANVQDDPQILLAAYFLYFYLGRDEEANSTWLKQAIELSQFQNDSFGPISLNDFVNDVLPKRNATLFDTEKKWFEGEIPMCFAADVFNISLVKLLLHISAQNSDEVDGRKRRVLPIVAGSRVPIDLTQSNSIGIDVTSTLILFHLGLLQKTIDAFDHVKIAPDFMSFLYREQFDARFHQPSRIYAAKQLLEIKDSGKITIAKTHSQPSKSVVDEVGQELAELLDLAKKDNGNVVCVLPIHKGTLLDEKANTDEFNNFIISVTNFCEVLYRNGTIGEDDYSRALFLLKGYEDTTEFGARSLNLGNPIYVDRLALDWLLDAKILKKIANSSMDIRAHAQKIEEMQELANEEVVSDDLIRRIENVRIILRSAMENGKVTFLQRSSGESQRMRNRLAGFEVTRSLIAASDACDAICIDDRFFNRHLEVETDSRERKPIVCISDILHFLVSKNHISANECWTARAKLRSSGFVFIVPETNELIYWLTKTNINANSLIECQELRIIRQNVALFHFLELANKNEAIPLYTKLRSSCHDALIEIWENPEYSINKAKLVSDWIWHCLLLAVIPGQKKIIPDKYFSLIEEILSLLVGSLLFPMLILSRDRCAQYASWVEQSILGPLKLANTERIEAALDSLHSAILDLKADHQISLGNLFLDQLPQSARALMFKQKPKFAKDCGFEQEHVISVGPTIQLKANKLFAAAEIVLDSNEETLIQDISGQDVFIVFDAENNNVVLKWSDGSTTCSQKIPILPLLSSNIEVRSIELSKISRQIGPPSMEVMQILERVKFNKPNYSKLSLLFNEYSDGVKAAQMRLARIIQDGLPINFVDLVPEKVSYFEKFAGPNPITESTENYLTKTLVSYRKHLLKFNLQTGLEICCLGALRDDLMPGQWVLDCDNDQIWEILQLTNFRTTPIATLAALDIALYRQEDKRFRQYAEETVSRLLSEIFSDEDGPDHYQNFQILINAILMGINFIDYGPIYPNYWKRLSAWMQAGLVTSWMEHSYLLLDTEKFENWLSENIGISCLYAGLINSYDDPMLPSTFVDLNALKSEILARLLDLQSRHENEGRTMPHSKKLKRILTEGKVSDEIYPPIIPGPLNGHMRPTISFPAERINELVPSVATEDSDSLILLSLMRASQFYTLGRTELKLAFDVVEKYYEPSCDMEKINILSNMSYASLVAAMNRDEELAEEIAKVIIKVSSRVTSEEVPLIFTILLQAAATYNQNSARVNWLMRNFEDVALQLPMSPSDCPLNLFLHHLNCVSDILPAHSWFHIRARSIALAGISSLNI